ncbi:sugar ABC transporter substrate-binding protein, partial [Streptomyces sp. SID8455]|nr:sugar ABC transporter substrate-binding protein [Streptomyces sp. SID8455]
MPCTNRTTRLALAASAASLALLTTACGGGSGPDASGPGDGGKPVTLTFWSATAGAKETAEAFNRT